MFLIKNTTKFQMIVELSESAGPDQSIIIPAKAYREYDLTDDEAAFIRTKYGRDLVLKPKA